MLFWISEDYADIDSLIPEEWCQTIMLHIHEDQFSDDKFRGVPDYIYICTGK